LLESAEGPRRLAQYSFIGFSPSKIIEAKNGNYRETNSEGASATTHAVAPLSLLRKVLVENYPTYRGFRFVGGVVGYLSYDSVRYLESIPNHTRDDLKFFDFEFGIYDDGIVFDHLAS